MNIIEEAREIMFGVTRSSTSGSGISESTTEQYEAAAEFIEGGDDFRRIIMSRLDKIDAGFKKANVRLERHKSIGVGRTEAPSILQPVLRDIRKLEKLIRSAVESANKSSGLKE